MTAFTITSTWQLVASAGSSVEVENLFEVPIYIMTSTGLPSDPSGIVLFGADGHRALNMKQDLYARTNAVQVASLEVMAGLVPSFWPLPSNIYPPTIAGGPNVGKGVFVQSRGKWNGGDYVDLTHQWARDGVPIAGATGEGNYTLVPADVGQATSVIETATNTTGSARLKGTIAKRKASWLKEGLVAR